MNCVHRVILIMFYFGLIVATLKQTKITDKVYFGFLNFYCYFSSCTNMWNKYFCNSHQFLSSVLFCTLFFGLFPCRKKHCTAQINKSRDRSVMSVNTKTMMTSTEFAPEKSTSRKKLLVQYKKSTSLF